MSLSMHAVADLRTRRNSSKVHQCKGRLGETIYSDNHRSHFLIKFNGEINEGEYLTIYYMSPDSMNGPPPIILLTLSVRSWQYTLKGTGYRTRSFDEEAIDVRSSGQGTYKRNTWERGAFYRELFVESQFISGIASHVLPLLRHSLYTRSRAIVD